MKLYQVTVVLEVEAENEDDACSIAEHECSIAFLTCLAVNEVNTEK